MRIKALLLTFAMAAGLPLAARSAVTDCTEASLRAELARTNYITFTCAGTITLTAPIVIANDTTIDASGRNVVLSGNNATRLITAQAGATLVLINLKLTGGKSNQGGAILNRGIIYASDCLFAGNNATGAKGADGANGQDSNTNAGDGGNGNAGVPGLGGAIYNEHTISLTRCTFATNAATGGAGGKGGKGGNAINGGATSGDGGNGAAGGVGRGGAILNNNYAVLTDCIFERNTAIGGNGGALGEGGAGGLPGKHGRGGAGAVGSGAAIHNAFFLGVQSSTFSDNRAEGGDSEDTAEVSNSSGENGLAGAEAWGGGVCNVNTAYLVNSTFSTNRVFGGDGGDGADGEVRGGRGGNGGIGYGGNFFSNGNSGITNCTFAGGGARGGTNGVGGAGATAGENGTMGANRGGNVANLGGQFRLKNNIIARPGQGANGYGQVGDFGYNISSDASLNLNAPTSFINTSPLLGQLLDNGGFTKTFAINTNSPARDKGDPDPEVSPETDQRGTPIFGEFRDIGAYELAIARIHGKITTPDGTGLDGVVVEAGSSVNTVSSNGGFFSFAGLPAGEYTITPSDPIYTFEPPSETVTLEGPDIEIFFIGFRTFTVSGHVRDAVGGIAGITVQVGGQQALTDTNGLYEIAGVPAGFNTITPSGSGYTFIPELRQIDVQADTTDIDFSAVGVFSISGRVTESGLGLTNVLVTAGNRSAITSPTGDYTITEVPAGTQIVVPSRLGYSFQPASFPVSVNGDESGINFTAYKSYQVTGVVLNLSNNLGAAGVTLNLRTNVAPPLPPGSLNLTTTTDTNGAFGFTNIPGGTYTLAAARSGHAFTPVTNLLVLNTNLHFTNRMYPIFSMAGRVTSGGNGISNATVIVRTNGSSQVLTNTRASATGHYSFANFTAGIYEIFPDVLGHQFTPTNYIVNLQANTNGLHFASVGLYAIRGTIRLGTAPLSNVVVRSSGATNVTDANGRYALTNLHPGTYTVTPSIARYSFEPLNATVSVGPDQSNVDFQAVETFTISGEIREGAFGLAAVQVTAGGRTNFTNPDGRYILVGVPAGANVLVTATLAGYGFTPPQRPVVLDANKTGIDFAARGLSTISGRVTPAPGTPLAFVQITAGADGRYRATTSSSGNYVLTNIGPGTITVTPSRTNRGFEPPLQTFLVPSATTITNIDFISYRAFRLGGRVLDIEEGVTNPIPNVAVTVVGNNRTNSVITDADGKYEFPTLRQGFNTITPSRAGLGFEPRFVELDLAADRLDVDFQGFEGFSISGAITAGGVGVPDVEVTPAGTTNDVPVVRTGANGAYTISGLRPDIYTLFPVRPGYQFTPDSRQVEIGPSTNGINFTAQGNAIVGGRVLEGSAGAPNVSVRLTSTNNPPLNRTAITDPNGNFTFTNLPPDFVSVNAEPSVFFTPGSVGVDPLNYSAITFVANGGRLAIARQSTNTVRITVTALPNRDYMLQTTTNLRAVWTNLRPVTTSAAGSADYVHTITNTVPILFFRSTKL